MLIHASETYHVDDKFAGNHLLGPCPLFLYAHEDGCGISGQIVSPPGHSPIQP
jgi:hypothetical protein